MMRTRVKICGITSLEDALCAVEQGADAIGLVFYPPSPRCVSVETAASIVRELPAFVTTTALFVNEQSDTIRETIRATGISLLQFHGNECPDYCRSFEMPYIKALRMKPGLDLRAEMKRYALANSVLLDAYQPGIPGGTGESFDWEQIPADIGPGIILAGGLNADNIVQAIQTVRPYAVDVSGGVERDRGKKDFERIKQFMRGVSIAVK